MHTLLDIPYFISTRLTFDLNYYYIMCESTLQLFNLPSDACHNTNPAPEPSETGLIYVSLKFHLMNREKATMLTSPLKKFIALIKNISSHTQAVL